MKYYVKILIILFLSVLIPCVTVFGVTNVIIFEQYKESKSDSQLSRLRSIDSTNQLIIDNIEQGALRFSLEPSIQSLSGLTSLQLEPQINKYLSSLTRSMKMLNEFISVNELFDSVYLYINDSDYVISSRDSIVNLDRFADLGWMSKYKELRTNHKASRMMPAHTIRTGYVAAETGFTSYDRQCLTYVYPITPFTSSFNGALVFNIFEDRLLEMYMEPSPGSNIVLFDGDATWLMGIKDIDYADILSEENWNRIFDVNAVNKGYFFSNKNSQSLQYTYYRSFDNRYVLLSVENMSEIMQKATSFQLTFIIFLLLFVPFGALLILVVSRRLYSPISKLARELSTNGRLDFSGGEQDEWSTISRAVNELMREDQKLFSDREREKLKDATFLCILTGDDSEDDEDIKTILPYSRNICIIAAMDANISLLRKDKNYDSRLRLLVWLIEDELMGDSMCPTAMRYEGNSVVIILSVGENVQEIEQVLSSKLTVIQTEAEAVMGHTVSFAVGSLSDNYASARLSFGQAKNVLQYRFMKGLKSILFYDHVYSKLEYYNAAERLKYIQHCLHNGKKDEVLQSTAELVHEIELRGNVSYTYTSQILNQLVTALAQYAIENSIQLEELLGENIIYTRLWENLTLNEACEWFCSTTAIVMDYQNAEASSGSEYVKRIIEYVSENYSRDITIDSVASHIGISYSYLRKLHKEATGQNLADYINKLRIEKSKQLLHETNYTVKEIAAMCGYNHERSFSRSFSQMEGMSPGKYKDLYKNGLK